MAPLAWTVICAVAAQLALAAEAGAQYREAHEAYRLPERVNFFDRMKSHKSNNDAIKSFVEKGWDLAQEKIAEHQVRQSEILARQFEKGQKVVVFRIPRVDVAISQLGDTLVKQHDPIYVGSGDSFEEVHDEYVLDYQRPQPVLRNASGPPRPFEIIDSNQVNSEHPGGFYFVVTRNGEGGYILEKKYIWGDPYLAALARKKARANVKQFGNTSNVLHQASDDFFFNRLARELAKQRAERLREAARREEEDRRRADRNNRERVGGAVDRDARVTGAGRPHPERPRDESPSTAEERELREWEAAKDVPSTPLRAGERDPQGPPIGDLP